MTPPAGRAGGGAAPGEQAPGRPAPGGVPAGRVGRPHGLDGSFYVTRPRARLLALGVPVTVGGRTAAVARRAGTEQRPIVRLEGVEDRAAAEALRGLELAVDGRRAPELGEGEWWAHELEGCVVADGGRLLGTVTRLVELPSCEALEVRGDGRERPVLVPMVADAIRAVDPARGRIEVNLDFLDLPEDASPAPGASAGRRGRGARGGGRGGKRPGANAPSGDAGGQEEAGT